ncbi:hypothetical protein KIPB_003161 [Kipferlia bialata]|uniref:Uncharacterized protein n=1 Tax=Kipferlia bialata TaxID=797122 RepID=A0A391NSW5_9EUKA|nr:hypothetical protein KIPB_003161 [Kipferlia bialata]|eukprot:g3161.t1
MSKQECFGSLHPTGLSTHGLRKISSAVIAAAVRDCVDVCDGEFSICDVTLSMDEVHLLCRILPILPHVAELKLCNCGLDNRAARLLAETLPKIDGLREIDLSGNRITDTCECHSHSRDHRAANVARSCELLVHAASMCEHTGAKLLINAALGMRHLKKMDLGHSVSPSTRFLVRALLGTDDLKWLLKIITSEGETEREREDEREEWEREREREEERRKEGERRVERARARRRERERENESKSESEGAPIVKRRP